MANDLHLLSLLLLLPLLPLVVTAQTYTNVTLNQSLSTDDTSPWLSPSSEFAFGFLPLDDTDAFLLAIWFYKIPDKTTVWYANGDKPAPRGSRVQLTINGQLELKDPQDQVIWKTEPNDGGVTNGAMLDTGNFVLTNGNYDLMWESFKNRSDTILPTQILEVDAVVSSRQTETNYSRGRFQLRLLQGGNLVLNTVGLPGDISYDSYYKSPTFNANSGYKVVFNESGFINVEIGNGSIFQLTSGSVRPSKTHYLRATLDSNGVFTQYAYPRTSSDNQSWSIVWSIPDNICLAVENEFGSGVCGYNSYCRLTEEKRPICECPYQYSFVDPKNKFSDCQPNFKQLCYDERSGNLEDLYEFQKLVNTDWPFNDYEQLYPFNQTECEKSCLYDCYCGVAIFRNETCWKKRLPLSNGRVNSNINGTALIKYRKDNNSPPAPAKKEDQWKLILVGSLLGSSVFFNFLLLLAIPLLVYFKYHKNFKQNEKDTTSRETNLPAFTYKDLKEATDGFKEELGRGSFGVVYKGVLGLSSRKTVAVKKLDNVVCQGEREFKNEVNAIGQTHHKNLVRLLGFCDEGQHRLLVYEFMSNGTLASFLFGFSRPDWNQRIQMALGIARGLVYLHEECSSQIIHCDIKPQNILLDDYFIARISDFGLAKLLMTNQSGTRTAIRGTKGYVAPEWFRNTPVSVKVDVYSFGVMLLEIICCRKSVEMEFGDEERKILTDWAYDCYRLGRLGALVENDTEAMNDMSRLERLVKVAIWCIQEDPSLRPTMKQVTQMLEGVVEVSIPPCPSPFSSV